jgi:hypothetical protein
MGCLPCIEDKEESKQEDEAPAPKLEFSKVSLGCWQFESKDSKVKQWETNFG